MKDDEPGESDISHWRRFVSPFQGWDLVLRGKPQAAPWAELGRPVGAEVGRALGGELGRVVGGVNGVQSGKGRFWRMCWLDLFYLEPKVILRSVGLSPSYQRPGFRVIFLRPWLRQRSKSCFCKPASSNCLRR